MPNGAAGGCRIFLDQMLDVLQNFERETVIAKIASKVDDDGYESITVDRLLEILFDETKHQDFPRVYLDEIPNGGIIVQYIFALKERVFVDRDHPIFPSLIELHYQAILPALNKDYPESTLRHLRQQIERLEKER